MIFYKYQGTGNDFIMLQAFDQPSLSLTSAQIKRLCDRRFGIGGDGLIILRPTEEADFHMDYYNSDGLSSSMCGNGGRCAVKFAHDMHLAKERQVFTAPDGFHEAIIVDGRVRLKMQDVISVKELGKDSFELNTGSPHLVMFSQDVRHMDVYKDGSKLRYSDTYKAEGINVNFVQKISDHTLFVRTYERGVEGETFSCGTGVTAAAIALSVQEESAEAQTIHIETLGGTLEVSFQPKGDHTFENIWLSGPAEQVFHGEITKL